MLLLERFDRLEPLLIERLQVLRADEKRGRWRDIRHRDLDQASVVARAQRAALEAIESLRAIGQETLRGGLQIEAGSLPGPPMVHDRELILAFETAIERQASATSEPVPVKKPKAKPTAPAPAASAGYDHAAALKSRAPAGGSVSIRVLPEYISRGGKNWPAWTVIHVALNIADQMIDAGTAERFVPGEPSSVAPRAPRSPRRPAVEAAPAPAETAPTAADLPVDADGLVTVLTLKPGLPLPAGGVSGRTPVLCKLSPGQAMGWLRNGMATVPTESEIAQMRSAEIMPAAETLSAAKVEAAA